VAAKEAVSLVVVLSKQLYDPPLRGIADPTSLYTLLYKTKTTITRPSDTGAQIPAVATHPPIVYRHELAISLPRQKGLLTEEKLMRAVEILG